MGLSKTRPMTSARSERLQGTAKVPGDKSISHRALILGALARGETIISGLLESEDIINTATALNHLGAKIVKTGDGLWHASGPGPGNLVSPDTVLDMGNSGTSTRLLAGLCSGSDITAFFAGDVSLTKRPMKRIMFPLEDMGAKFMARNNENLPMGVKGSPAPQAIYYKLPVASAQVKSAVLFCALTAEGKTTVVESTPTRDHSENILRHFGAEIQTEKNKDNGELSITLSGFPKLKGCALSVPADPSSAAFPAVAAAIHRNSSIKISGVGVNERRTGLYQTLSDMGVNIFFTGEHIEAGEKIADIEISSSGELRGIDIPPERNVNMIDEFPVLAVAASCAKGQTRMVNLKELRVKESDRLLMIANGLKSCGVNLEVKGDDLIIHGDGKPPRGGAFINCAMDHRIAMSFLVLGSVTPEPVTIDDGRCIETSFPGFADMMNDLGMVIEEIEKPEALYA